MADTTPGPSMHYDPKEHHRRSVRLRGYDYSFAGAYFVTICALDRRCLFGSVSGGQMKLSSFGLVVVEELNRLAGRFATVELDAWVVMPNHMHGFLLIADDKSPRPHLGEVVAYFKYQSTKRINLLRGTPGVRVWQRSYHDHIIRNDRSLDQLREYVEENPRRWELDRLHPQAASHG